MELQVLITLLFRGQEHDQNIPYVFTTNAGPARQNFKKYAKGVPGAPSVRGLFVFVVRERGPVCHAACLGSAHRNKRAVFEGDGEWNEQGTTVFGQ